MQTSFLHFVALTISNREIATTLVLNNFRKTLSRVREIKNLFCAFHVRNGRPFLKEKLNDTGNTFLKQFAL